MLRARKTLQRIAMNGERSFQSMPDPSSRESMVDENQKVVVKRVPLTDAQRFHQGISVQDMSIKTLLNSNVVLQPTPPYRDNPSLQEKSDIGDTYSSEEFAQKFKEVYGNSNGEIINPQNDGAVTSVQNAE